MKVLITGGAGFIGSHVIEKLLKEDCKITVLDNLHTGLRENVPEGIDFIEMDVCDQDIVTVLTARRFDAVIHLAGQTMVNVSVDDPYFDAQVNLLGTINLLEACRKTGVKRVIFATTAAAYGDIEEMPVLESFATEPTSFYGLSKLTVEKYLQLYHTLHDLEYVALRFANVYGERQGDGGEGGVISIFAKRIANGESISIYGDGNQTRDFIYVGDVAAAICQSLGSSNCNSVYNISTKTEVSVNTVVTLFGEISGRAIAPAYCPARSGDIYRSVLSNDQAVAALDWQPKTSLKEGLARTYQYFFEKNKK
ncbi:NAD-dependent epimerase/dehydratase family protein [Anaerosinus massiliensis]|uniref:NAD-dependent epimerase/dehydratase family protein n=1 Tax=Massilibacillus massiliensis TaxID=1806837 RepID=UPI000AD51D68|nr:NAD-dependent epimerase/dehydratase family protein [Massilibacillus massiliensis]